MTANVLLVADDMPNNLSVMRTMISKYLPGCELITATGAEEGLTMAADANVDAVLLDVQMAKMTGIEMCRQLKSNERTADLPVILVTPRRTPSKLKAEGLEAGADDFLSKPIDGIELVAKIKAALRLKHTGTRVPEIADHPDRPVAEKTGAIVQQERMIRSVLASMQDDVLLIDRDYQIVDVNESALATIEKKREEVIGRRCHEVYHGLHGPCSEHGRPCLLPTVLSTGEPARYQEVITRSDGSEIHVDTLLSPLIDDQGDVDSVVLVGRDVTALVEAQEALSESEERFRTFSEMTSDFAFQLSLTDAGALELGWLTEGVAESFGFSAGDMVRQASLDGLVPPGSLPIMEDLVARTLSGQSCRVNVRLRTKDGESRWVALSARPRIDASGEIVGINGAGRDITESVQAEEELAEHRDCLQKLVEERTAELTRVNHELRFTQDNVQASIWYKDTENRILRVNQAAANYLGLSVEEVEGKSVEEFFPQAASQFNQESLAVIESGEPSVGVVKSFVNALGEERWAVVDEIPLRDAAGNVSGVVVCGVDITDNVKADQKLENRSSELHTMVKAMAGRENRMVELKNVIAALRSQLREAGLDPVADDGTAR